MNNGLEFQGLPKDNLNQITHRLEMQLGGGLKEVKLPMDEVNSIMGELSSIEESVDPYPTEYDQNPVSSHNQVSSHDQMSSPANQGSSPNIQTVNNRTKKVTPNKSFPQNSVQNPQNTQNVHNPPQGYARVQPPVAASQRMKKQQLVRSPSTSWENNNNNDGSRPASLNVQNHLLPKQTVQSRKPPQNVKPPQSVMPDVSSVSLNTAHYENNEGSVQNLQEHPMAQSLSRQSSGDSIDYGKLHPNAVVVQGGEIVHERGNERQYHEHGHERQNHELENQHHAQIQHNSEVPKTVKVKKIIKIKKKVLKKKSSGEEKAQSPELMPESTQEPLKLKTKRVKSSSNTVASPRSDEVSPINEVSRAQEVSPIRSHTSINHPFDQLQNHRTETLSHPETIPDSPTTGTNRIVQVIEVEETTVTRRKKKGTVLVKTRKRKEKPHKEKNHNLPEEVHHEMADAYAQQEIKNMPNNVGLIEREETIIFDENELSQNKHNSHKSAKSSKKQHKLIELIGEDAAKTVLDEQKLNVDQKLPREQKSSSSASKRKLHKTQSSASSSGEFPPPASTPTASSSYQNIHSSSVSSSSNHKKSLSKSHSSPHPSSQSTTPSKYHPTTGTELPSDLSRESTEIAQEPTQKLEKKSKKDKKSKKLSSSKKTPDDEDLYRRVSNDSSSGVSTMNESGVVSTPERKGSAEGNMSKIVEGDSALNNVNAILKKEKRKKRKEKVIEG